MIISPNKRFELNTLVGQLDPSHKNIVLNMIKTRGGEASNRCKFFLLSHLERL